MRTIEVDNRQVKVIHVFSPKEDYYSHDTGELVEVVAAKGGCIRLVFNEGDDVYIDDLAMYGSPRDNRRARPVAYRVHETVYLTETAEDVKFQTMQ